MILQALYEYYERKAADPDSLMAPEGFEWKEIPYLIIIDPHGKFVRLESTIQGEGKAKTIQSFLVPQGEKKAAGIKANLLWDGPEYVLGANPRKRTDAADRHSAFVKRMHDTLDEHRDHPTVSALLAFLDSEPLAQVEATCEDSAIWEEIFKANPNLTFRVEGQDVATKELMNLLASIEDSPDEEAQRGLCLLTGQRAEITRLHPSVKGVWGAQSSGASLVSYNLPAFRSFDKDQNYNAPMGKRATFAYTTALNDLLAKDSDNRLQLGDSSTVFWAQKEAARVEKPIKSFFAMPPRDKDNPDKGAADTKQALLAVLNGINPEERSAAFYMLGLSPNAARISVRFWHQGTVGEFARHMRQHLDDLDIVAPKHDQERVGLTYLLCSLVLAGKIESIPPNLAGNVIQAVLTNSPYPETLMHQCLRRIRAEREVDRIRAAILKACLNRRLRRSNLNHEKEITVSLDTSNLDPGYRLGRLFAVLEKIQEDANPGINATIRDRFYGAASSNPVAVFPQLLKLKNHHLAKLPNRGQAVNHEKRLAEIFDGLTPEMPPHLPMDEQAKFAIGYYHQRQALRVKNEIAKNESTQGDLK
jgi:CRISPR-associated protein Csd1